MDSPGSLQSEIAKQMQEWFESGLQQWDISRDAPYLVLKFQVQDKFFYVWLMHPIGYMASFKISAIVKALIFNEFGRKTAMLSFITLSVKRYRISTAYSGQQCWKEANTVNVPMCLLTVMSP